MKATVLTSRSRSSRPNDRQRTAPSRARHSLARVQKSHQPSVFSSTLQKTNLWLKELGESLHWPDHHKAYHGLRAVLHALRDRLPVSEAAHLGAQLPMLIRGFYYEEWKPNSTPVKFKTAQEFYDAVKGNLTIHQDINPKRLTEAVLRLLARHLGPEELQKLQAMFPLHLREIWRGAEQTVDLSEYV